MEIFWISKSKCFVNNHFFWRMQQILKNSKISSLYCMYFAFCAPVQKHCPIFCVSRFFRPFKTRYYYYFLKTELESTTSFKPFWRHSLTLLLPVRTNIRPQRKKVYMTVVMIVKHQKLVDGFSRRRCSIMISVNNYSTYTYYLTEHFCHFHCFLIKIWNFEKGRSYKKNVHIFQHF